MGQSAELITSYHVFYEGMHIDGQYCEARICFPRSKERALHIGFKAMLTCAMRLVEFVSSYVTLGRFLTIYVRVCDDTRERMVV